MSYESISMWMQELEAFGPLVSSEPRPQREASVAAVLEARAELRAQQERREALEDEQLTLRQDGEEKSLKSHLFLIYFQYFQ